jgi:hypothetical protein
MSHKKDREETFKVKLSSPFLVRTRCKYCGSLPVDYFRMGGNRHFKDFRDFLNIFSWVPKHNKRLCSDFYLMDDPSSFYVMSNFSYSVPYKAYNPSIHHKRGIRPTRDINECLVCECGRTYWVFKQQAVMKRPEIVNRKSNREFPQKFKY